MLYLQRASAGSGKTYTLAYTFIRDYITAFDKGQRVLLRSERRLADSLTHILAITFTNKATNEMKTRIVEKLAALADISLPEDKVEYLKELKKELKVSREQIADTCSKALGIMLNNYSDLHVSTIDSFFQSVLRTFAYETDLNESYQVELDSNYIDRAAIDAVLEQVNNSQGSDPEAEFWISVLMNRSSDKGTQWNVFQRSEARRSLYSSIRNMMKELDNEDFRRIKEDLDDYFTLHPDLRSVYTYLEKRYDDINNNLRKIRSKATEEAIGLLQNLSTQDTDKLKKRLLNSIRKLSGIKDTAALEEISLSDYNPDQGQPRVMKKTACKSADLPRDNEIGDMVQSLYETIVEYNALLTSTFRNFWDIYRINFPYLGLLQRVGVKKKEFLEANNLMQLGDTTTILSRIIGDDDTPFIYERLGTRLEHYLIDEFQDTSRMQWQLLSPLVHESHDKGFDNLIIGDAKQSIYRFRNADYSLITDKVPSEFDPETLAPRGTAPSENTNWRSDYNIVMWNNVIFKALVKKMQERIKGTDVNLDDIYSNIVQPIPAKKAEKPEGYIELRVFNTIRSNDNVTEDNTATDDEQDTVQPVLSHIPSLIRSLIARGYRQRDIAVLVRNNKTGQAVIEELITDNTVHSELSSIEFISEQSLLVSNSKAVRVVISTLESIARGNKVTESGVTTEELADTEQNADNTNTDDNEGIDREVSWQEIKNDFAFYALQHPELTPAERLQAFRNKEHRGSSTDEIIAKMQAVALPALVEALIENFVDSSLRNSHTPFLAALQDMVMDYCRNFPSDITSFLKWWKKEGCLKSISSPKDVDAVQIMTLHKAKGLEFRCVIMPEPEITLTMRPNSGIVWLPSVSIDPEGVKLPPYLPLTVNKSLEQIDTSGLYQKLSDLTVLDAINMGYVAFTRAVSELYILTSTDYTIKDGIAKKTISRKNTSSFARYLIDVCEDFDKAATELSDSKGLKINLSSDIDEIGEAFPGVTDAEGNILPAAKIYRFGKLCSPLEKDNEKEKNKDNTIHTKTIDTYRVNSKTVVLQYSEPKVPVVTDDPEEDPDPRSLGNLMHAVMAEVICADDLDTALRRFKVKGLIDNRTITEARKILRDAIGHAPAEWFDGSMRVMNERSLLTGNRPEHRPDRIMVTPDRRCIVVDYKFGLPGGASEATLQSYRNQVTRYARLLASTGLYTNVEAWLWHVPYSAPVRIPLKPHQKH
ncbi:MAG: UvrD-helicase domain-containing protein [Muribaculaceae bacterium]|nr:UvrD-helicase domain-containing protein [Muribaculaceae bacterium]